MAQIEEINNHPDQAIRHFDDAILIAETCKKLDPYNDQITGLINQVKSFKKQTTERAQAINQSINQIDAMEAAARTNPANVQNLVMLGGAYLQMQQTNRAVELFNVALSRPEMKLQEAQYIAQYFAQVQDFAKLEMAIKKMISLAPYQPEQRCDLAALQSITGQHAEALQNLKAALELSAQRLATNPAAPDLVAAVRNDPRFAAVRSLPEFQKLVPPK